MAIGGPGKTPVPAWADPEALAQAQAAPRGRHRAVLLSPFDSLVWDRKRTLRMFGFEHSLEAYVPKPKRVFGYFACPVLVGDEIVAALDLKADRERSKLLIQQWTWVGNGSSRMHKKRIEAALGAFERFQLAG